MNTPRHLVAALSAVALAAYTYAQTPGLLDPNFNAVGYTISNMATGSGNDIAYAVLKRSNGYSLIGSANRNGTMQVSIARYLNDGTLAQQVHGNDVVHQHVSAALGSDAFTVVGYSDGGNGARQWFIRKYNADLTPETFFGTSGVLKFGFDPNLNDNCVPFALASQPGFFNTATQSFESRLVVAGYSGSSVAVARVKPSGVPGGHLDATFSNDGKLLIDIPDMTNERAYGVAIDADRHIFIAGYGTSSNTMGGAEKGFIVKLTPNGDLDLSWGTNGVRLISYFESAGTIPVSFHSRSTRLNAINIDPNGKLLVCGKNRIDGGAANWDFYSARFNADGTNDTSFGTNGRTIVPFAVTGSSNEDEARAMAIQPDGRIVLCGKSGGGVALVRLESNGALDSSFGTGGKVETSIPSSESAAGNAMVIDNIKIVVGGYRASGSTDFLILRYLTGSFVGILEFPSTMQGSLVYPNPIAGSTTLSYTLVKSERLTIALHDMQGRVITTFMDGVQMPAGEHSQVVTMPGDLAPGNYLVVFSTPDGASTVQVTK